MRERATDRESDFLFPSEERRDTFDQAKSMTSALCPEYIRYGSGLTISRPPKLSGIFATTSC